MLFLKLLTLGWRSFALLPGPVSLIRRKTRPSIAMNAGGASGGEAELDENELELERTSDWSTSGARHRAVGGSAGSVASSPSSVAKSSASCCSSYASQVWIKSSFA